VVAIRGSDLDAFARFLGASPGKAQAPQAKVQTYAHRTLLAWIGWQIWKDHPLLGVGWEGSAEPANFVRYLPAAHRRSPDEAPRGVSERLQPSRTSVQYAVRKPLAAWLAAQDVRGLRVLDVGCGDRPYDTLLVGASEIVGFDVPGNAHADLHGSIDAIPVEDA